MFFKYTRDNNYLDKSFQKLLLPFRILHHMVFLSRFTILHNTIRPHGYIYYIWSFIGTFCFIVYHIKYLTAENESYLSNQFLLDFEYVHIFISVIPFFIFYFLNIIQRRDHVKLILKIQKVFRTIHYRDYRRTTMWNWSLIARHFICLLLSIALIPNLKLALYLFTLIYSDIHISYAVCLINLIRKGVLGWISKVEYHVSLEANVQEEVNEHFEKLFQAYVDLMDAYEIFKDIFKYTILHQAVDTFIHSLIYVQTVTEISKSGLTKYSDTHINEFLTLVLLWMIKNIMFVTIFCVHCENFYITVSEADAACSRWRKHILSTSQAKKLCKNVERLNRAAFRKMTACHIFTMDARMAQAFNSLEVEYIVILLQFAFVK